ncbi:MAG: uracil-DNA glycosylase [bacterium]
MLQCRRCPLWQTRTQAVPGVGPPTARVMMVGEAPGRQEDLKGEPFVGTAGRFFDSLLASVGLTREDVYITNAVKSRPYIGPPPGHNRTPSPGEISACRPWLDEQLRIIEPEIVVAMGRIALEYFLPGRKISEIHGKPQRQNGRIILPVFHPALARYGPELQATLRADFLKLRELMAGEPAPG